MKIATCNLNGLRSAIRRGFLEWLREVQPDVLCLQEIKADAIALQEVLKGTPELADAYKHAWHPAEKKGYSGVALLSKEEPAELAVGCGNPTFDAEGRVLRATFASGIQVMSLYLPSGTQGNVRQTVKEDFMAYFYDWVTTLPGWQTNLVIAGDFNIAHQAIDVHDPARLKNFSGFFPHERDWMTKLLQAGFTDSFRHLNAEPNHYTWWSFRSGAKVRNLGWRIDYQLVSNGLTERLRSHSIHCEYKMSDHAPCVLEIAD